jgi:hypothetical protein
MPDLLPVKYKAPGDFPSEIYGYATGGPGQVKTTQFGGAIITPETGYSYAPTNETNFYNGYEVPVGGYVMVSSNVDNTHSFYSFNSDNDLINFTNVTFGQNFSTIQNSLDYLISSATTWTVLNYNKPLIPFNYFTTQSISAGFYYEFGNTMSYPKTGNDVYEIDGNTIPAVANNGPIFSGTTPGFFTFDGTNDYVNVPYNVNLNPSSNISVSLWLTLTATDTTIRNPIDMSATAGEDLYFIYWRADLSPKRWGWGVKQSNNTYAETTSAATNFSTNTWYNIALVANSSAGQVYFYYNGILDGGVAYNGTIKQNASATLSIAADAANSRRYWQGNISNTLIYNRALSTAEVLQNYNATKNRFGL